MSRTKQSTARVSLWTIITEKTELCFSSYRASIYIQKRLKYKFCKININRMIKYCTCDITVSLKMIGPIKILYV